MRTRDQAVIRQGIEIPAHRFSRDIEPLRQFADPDMRAQLQLQQYLTAAVGFLEPTLALVGFLIARFRFGHFAIRLGFNLTFVVFQSFCNNFCCKAHDSL